MNNILLIEEEEDIAIRLKTEFEANNVNVYICRDRKSAELYINDSHQFDAVILDWFFQNPEDSTISKLILKKLNKTHFRPVFIYTNNKPNYEQTPHEEIDFPQNLISCHSKETGFKELMSTIDRLLENNVSLQIADTYRKSIHKIFERVLFELNSMPNIDIARLLHCIYTDGENIDWSSDLIINLLHRALISDQDFVNNISELLRKNNPEKSSPNSEVSKKIANRLLYFHSKSNYIKNGDIISVTHDNGRVLLYGMVVTPDCDLDLLKTKYLEVVELEFLNSGRLGLKDDQINLIRKYQFDSYFFLPSVLLGENLEDFVAILKSKRIIEELPGSNIKKYPGSRTRFTFNSSHLYNNLEVKLNLICSITNPYKSEFLQKLHTNNSRVGIPNIKELFN